jgi:hypothetical protein
VDYSDRARGYRRRGAFEFRNILPNVLMSRMESRRKLSAGAEAPQIFLKRRELQKRLSHMLF